jgi:hypothetical protein
MSLCFTKNRSIKRGVALSILFTITLFIAFITIQPFSISNKKGNNEKQAKITWGSKIKSNPYRLHVEAGKQKTGKPYKTKIDIYEAHKKGVLTRITSGKGLIITDLTHSEPYLHPDAGIILYEIGKEFFTRSKRNRMIVNSLTRTIEDQRELTKTNPVASPNTSSHSYAVSFDIAYSKFNRNKKYDHDCHRILEEVLTSFQNKKKIYIIREKQSACYHITVRKRSDWVLK